MSTTEAIMSSVEVDDRVVVLEDVPDHSLLRGQEGVVCSLWFLPNRVIEVEFLCSITGEVTRVLLMSHQIAIAEGRLSDTPQEAVASAG